jgi:hypothetical protein
MEELLRKGRLGIRRSLLISELPRVITQERYKQLSNNGEIVREDSTPEGLEVLTLDGKNYLVGRPTPTGAERLAMIAKLTEARQNAHKVICNSIMDYSPLYSNSSILEAAHAIHRRRKEVISSLQDFPVDWAYQQYVDWEREYGTHVMPLSEFQEYRQNP